MNFLGVVDNFKAFLLLLQFPRTRAKSHSESQVERHLNLALHSLEATQHQLKDLVSVVKDQSQQIERLMSTVQDQARQIGVLTTTAKRQSEEMEALKAQVNVQPQQRKNLDEEQHEGKDVTGIGFDTKGKPQQKCGWTFLGLKEKFIAMDLSVTKQKRVISVKTYFCFV